MYMLEEMWVGHSSQQMSLLKTEMPLPKMLHLCEKQLCITTGSTLQATENCCLRISPFKKQHEESKGNHCTLKIVLF